MKSKHKIIIYLVLMTTIIMILNFSCTNSSDPESNNNEPLPSPAEKGVIYGVSGHSSANTPFSFISIDPQSGAGTHIGNLNVKEDWSVNGLAINSSGDIYFATYLPPVLYQIDAASGKTTHIMDLGFDYGAALAFDMNDELFAMEVTSADIYKIDLKTKVKHLVGETNIFFPAGMAFEPNSNKLWVCGSPNSIPHLIYKIDIGTLDVSLIGNTNLVNGVFDVVFDQDGNLYGVSSIWSENSDFISISKTDAKCTIIGSTGYSLFGVAARMDSVIVAP